MCVLQKAANSAYQTVIAIVLPKVRLLTPTNNMINLEAVWNGL